MHCVAYLPPYGEYSNHHYIIYRGVRPLTATKTVVDTWKDRRLPIDAMGSYPRCWATSVIKQPKRPRFFTPSVASASLTSSLRRDATCGVKNTLFDVVDILGFRFRNAQGFHLFPHTRVGPRNFSHILFSHFLRKCVYGSEGRREEHSLKP